MYYIDGIEQNQIADREKISRATVSRLLALAREKKFVTITVNDDFQDAEVIAKELSENYKNVNFNVISTAQDNQKTRFDKMTKSVSDYLGRIVKNGDAIGLGYGDSILRVAEKLTTKDVRDVEVLLLCGVSTEANYQTYNYTAACYFANAYHTKARPLPLPLVFDSKENKRIVEEDSHIKYVEKLGRVSNVILFTLNGIENNSFLNNTSYFTKEQQVKIREKSLGEILAHFIDKNGNIVDKETDQQIVTIPLKNLLYKEHSIVIVDEPSEVPILSSVLKAGYANEVFIDQQNADYLLRYSYNQ